VIQHRIVKTRWGYCGFVASPHGLVATFLPEQTRSAAQRRIEREHPRSKENDRLLPRLADSLRAYFEGRPARFNVRLALDGVTEFRRRVLQACRKIPRGKTAAYADLARAAGSPNAGRAVGSAMANNPLPLIVPCHRVVRSDGTIGGFSSPQGLILKRCLLRLEGAPPV
jgi:O-6-methylguanine DNA methyltransferase